MKGYLSIRETAEKVGEYQSGELFDCNDEQLASGQKNRYCSHGFLVIHSGIHLPREWSRAALISRLCRRY